MRRVLGEPGAIHLWLAVTLAGLVIAAIVGRAVWAVVGWAVGGVAAVVLAAVKAQWPPERALIYPNRRCTALGDRDCGQLKALTAWASSQTLSMTVTEE